jgi:hypothetical protein
MRIDGHIDTLGFRALLPDRDWETQVDPEGIAEASW